MKVFLDTASLEEVKKFLSWGICDGVTTNPSINIACGVRSFEEMRVRSLQIAELIAPRPLSVEVTSDDAVEMLSQARDYARWAKNIVVKVTITTRTGDACLPVIHELAEEGLRVNATAMLTVNQAILAAKAGAKYLSLFGGRIDDEGGDAAEVIRAVREWLDRWGDACLMDPEIIVGSCRTTRNVTDWSLTGAHIVTVTPSVLSKILVNARTKETVSQFLDDAAKAMSVLTAAQTRGEGLR